MHQTKCSLLKYRLGYSQMGLEPMTISFQGQWANAIPIELLKPPAGHIQLKVNLTTQP